MIPGLTKNYNAGGAVTARRIVKFDGSGNIVVATAATDLLIGASTDVDAVSGGPIDVIHGGIARVKAGDTIAYGAKVTADSTGRVVPANPDATDTVSTIGIALESAVVNDEIDVLIVPGSLSDAENS